LPILYRAAFHPDLGLYKCIKLTERRISAMLFSYSPSERAARTGRKPQTGKEIQISARKVAKFKVGKKLADAVNKK